MERRLEPGTLGGRRQRPPGRPRLKERHALVGPRTIRDHVPAERITPRGHEPEQHPVLDVHERGDPVVVGRHRAARQRRHPAGELPLVELVTLNVVGQRLVLVLGEERRITAVDAEVPCVLDRRQLVVVVPLGPRHPAAGVHRLPPAGVELVRLRRARPRPLPAAAELGVLMPEILGRRPVVDELRPLALPRRVAGPVEKPVGQVVGPDHRDRAEAGDLRPRAGQAQDRT